MSVTGSSFHIRIAAGLRHEWFMASLENLKRMNAQTVALYGSRSRGKRQGCAWGGTSRI